MSNQIMPKTYWCEKCQEYPDEIREYYHHVWEERKWDGVDTYELMSSDGWEVTEVTCKRCDSNLEMREEGGEKDDKKGL